MEGIIQFFEDKLVPIAAKIGNQRHLIAIRDAFAALMPLVMAGAVALLLNNVVFSPTGLLSTFVGGSAESGFFKFTGEYISPILATMDAGTLSILGLALAFAIAYLRAQNEGQDALVTGTISIGSFIILGALGRKNQMIAPWIGHYLGSQGVFVALIVGLLVPAIYFAIVNRNLTIKMPDTVPPAVSRGFTGIIPGTVVLFLFAAVKFAITKVQWSGLEQMFGEAAANPNIFMLFEVYIAKPFASISQGPTLILIITILVPILWFFGLHGANLLAPVMSPIYGNLQNHNLQAYAQGVRDVGFDPLGQNTLAYWVSGSWDAYVWHGGSGATLPLILAILLFSKLRDQKEVARLSLAPGIFMINEPVLFGIPIVLNPIYIIPFVLNQPVLAMIGYYASISGFAGPIVNSIPWTTPPVLNALLATNFSIGAGIIAAVNFAIAFAFYVPFVFVANCAEGIEA